LWNYEIGSKNTFGNAVVLNVAAYRIDWSDMQVFRSFTCGATVIQNAGKSRSEGAELELRFAPFANLEITSSVAYTDAALKAVATGVPYSRDAELPGVPEWSTYLAGQYSFPLGGLDAYVRVDWQYVGDSVSDFDRTDTPEVDAYPQESYDLVGARFGIRSRSWEAALFVTNALDENAHTFVRDLALPGALTSTVTRPRTVGVNLKALF